MWTLIRYPELQSQLREDNTLIKPFVDEVLRWESPEHFGAYLQIPERTEGSKFEAAMMNWAAGELRVCWGEPTGVK